MASGTENVNRKPGKWVDVALAVVFDDQRRVLICRRKSGAVLGGYWEFPGGKCEPGESPAECAVREVAEETALSVRVQRPLKAIEHEYPHACVRLHPFVCRHLGGELSLREVAAAQWVAFEDLGNYAFPEANAALLQELAEGNTPPEAP
jgi:mutator protein MutT